jgi:hypothetical protein
MMGQAFIAMADLLETQENNYEDWHCSAIYGHTKSSKLYPFSRADQAYLESIHVRTVSQLYAINDLTGTIDRTENVDLIQAIPMPVLRHKLRELHRALKNLPRIGKTHVITTTCEYLFRQPRNLSSIFKKVIRQQLDQEIVIAPAYKTRTRDQVYVPEERTFNDAFKVLRLRMIPSKTRETIFQVLNRTVWTNNKAFKSHVVDSPNCQRCGELETMEHLLLECEHYSQLVWTELGGVVTEAFTEMSGLQASRVQFTAKEIIFNKPHPSILIYLTAARKKDIRLMIMLLQEVKRDIIYRRMNLPPNPNVVMATVRIQSHLLSVLKKLTSLYNYQGTQPDADPMPLLMLLIRKIESRIE